MRNLASIVVAIVIVSALIIAVVLTARVPNTEGITITDKNSVAKEVEYIIDATTKSKGYTNELVRFYDKETDIYCYVVDYSRNVSVSCVANPKPVP